MRRTVRVKIPNVGGDRLVLQSPCQQIEHGMFITTVLLPALAASGIDLADLLGGQPQILGELTDAVASEAATASGHSNTLDLGALDYDQCRRQLRTALQALKPGMTLTVDHGHELLSLRYEIEATTPRAYRWSLPTVHQDDPTRFTTLVEGT